MKKPIFILLVYLLSCATCYTEDPMALAQKYAQDLRVSEANREFQLALDLNPHNNIFRSQYAWHLQAFFLIEEALYQFNILLPLEPDKRIFYQTIGWDTHTLGQWDESISAFSHIYSVPELTLSNQFLVINKLFRDEQLAKIKEWEKSLPDEYMVRYRYAHLLYQKKKYSAAKVQFDILISQLPDNAFLYWSLGLLFEETGDYVSAKDVCQKALDLNSNSRTQWAVARILSKLQSCPSAFNLANQIAIEPSNSLLAALSKAEVYLECEEYAQAAHIYKEILRNYPYNRKALWGLLKTSSHTIS